MVRQVTIVLGRVSWGGDDRGEESNGAANRHTAMLPRRSSGVRISPASVNTASIQTTRAPALPLKSAQGWPPDAQQQGN